MTTLTHDERAVLVRAGFDESAIDQLDALAADTPWLGQLRWITRHSFWVGLYPFPWIIFGAAIIEDDPILYALTLAAAITPVLVLPMRRLLSALRDPGASSARTAIALAVRAAPSRKGEPDLALRELKSLAETVNEHGDPVTAFKKHAVDQRRSRMKLLMIAAGMGAVLAAIYALGRWLM